MYYYSAGYSDSNIGHSGRWTVGACILVPMYLAGYSDNGHRGRWTVDACILVPCIWTDIWTSATVAGGLWVLVSWSPVFGQIFGHWPQWQVDCGCPYPGPLYLDGYLDIDQSVMWTVADCILVPCILPDSWTFGRVTVGLWVPLSWSPVFGRIFGHWPQWQVDCGCLNQVPCIWPDIWTFGRMTGGLWVPVSWSPVFGRIFGHLAE